MDTTRTAMPGDRGGGHATRMKKDVVMVQNLQLLGFDPADALTTVGSARSARSDSSAVLHPNMLDRPNEKLFFMILHFLVLKIRPQTEQELKICWPIVTPHDKSNFKRLVQTVLQDLEKTGSLPVGSGHASRLNSGYGSRIVDLIWRLTTCAMKAQLHRDHPTYRGYRQSSTNASDRSEKVELLKAQIAMKNHQLQEQYLHRSVVQDEWVSFATAITRKISDIDETLQQLHHKLNKLDSPEDRAMFSQVSEGQRTTKLHQTKLSWQTIQETTTGSAYASSQQVLNTALQHHGDQPVLDGRELRPQRSFNDRLGPVNLLDVVKNADALLQLSRARLSQQESSLSLTSQDYNRMETLSREANAYVATLVSTLQQLRDQLLELKRSNESATRDLCIAMTASTYESNAALSLCPPTPADKVLQESDLVQSLKKCSMTEISAMAASSVRKANRRKSLLEMPTAEEINQQAAQAASKQAAGEESSVFRRLDYDLDEEDGDHPMEL